MHPVLFDFFGLFKLHTYGLLIAIGFLLGTQLGVRESERVDTSPDHSLARHITDLCFWILVVSMIGSRLLFIIVNWGDEYSKDPLKIFRIWEGGLVFYGGFIASVAYSAWFCWSRKINFLLVSDTLIPSVSLGHFFGRLGCFAAGCCWGAPADSSFPLAVQFPLGSLVHSSMRAHGEIGFSDPYTIHLHPVQLYESFGELSIFFLLLFVRSRKRFHGQALLTYLFVYPILRTLLEFVRHDAERGFVTLFGLQMSTGQVISLGVSLAAIVLLVSILMTRRAQQPSAA
ncbi:MAG: prolipoprotein diacylglyceryl transferase [Deltaproteobacteria bacterium]|nr:prolipoprotein diacylglyceryl transferase [Deltaproteobacteria bacterium]